MNTQKRLIREAVYKLQQIVSLIGVPPLIGITAVIIQQEQACVKFGGNLSDMLFTQFSLIYHSVFTHIGAWTELYFGWHKEALF